MGSPQQTVSDWKGWAPTSYKLNGVLTPYKWPYKWLSGAITPISGIVTLFLTDKFGPTLDHQVFLCSQRSWLRSWTSYGISGSIRSFGGWLHGADPATVEPKGRHKMPQDAAGYSVLPYYKWKMGVSPR